MKKFKGSIIINKPVDQVVALFLDDSHRGKYQDGFLQKEVTYGKSGDNGCEAILYYEMGPRVMKLTETVTHNRLPESYKAFYHHKHMDNTMKVSFKAIDDNTTQYDYEYEYVRVAWIIPRLMFILFPGMYKKQGEKWNKQFKEFVENF